MRSHQKENGLGDKKPFLQEEKPFDGNCCRKAAGNESPLLKNLWVKAAHPSLLVPATESHRIFLLVA